MKRNIGFLLGMIFILIACGGGDEDPMTETCDTADMTYTDDIASILNTSCAISGCHVEGGQSPELFSYVKVKEHVDGDNKIIGAINHEDGFVPMPYPVGSDKIDDCDIDKIEAWIADDAPE